MMTEQLATTEQDKQLAAPANPMQLLMVAGTDADPVKLEKLMELQERWEAGEARKAYAQAIAKFQGEMPIVHKGRKETTGKYQFAGYDDIMRSAREHLASNGLSVSFSQEETDATILVRCKVTHIGGHSETTPFTLPKDGPIKTRDGRNITSEAQAQGSANSYAKRYCLCNALNIVVSDEDTDAPPPEPVKTITQGQADDLREIMKTVGVDQSKVCAAYAIESLEDLPASKLPTVQKRIEASAKKKEAAE